MQKEYIYGLIGLVIGGLLTFLVVSNQPQKNTKVQSKNESGQMQRGGPSMSMTMEGMNDTLKGKTGDDFDKAFISGMIEHHNGAIAMANQAKISAKHDEIKKMADEIIAAQTTEINQMREWQKAWGYMQ